jgi:biotin carboxyl carrier protein
MKAETHGKLLELLDFAKVHNLAELSWQDATTKIGFRRRPQMKSQPVSLKTSNGQDAAPEEVSKQVSVKSPMVGTFRRAVSKDRPPLVMEGDHVKPGDRMGIVECMKIPTDVVSVVAGKIAEIFVDDGDVVEYGQPLFSVEPVDEKSNFEN